MTTEENKRYLHLRLFFVVFCATVVRCSILYI